MAKTFPVGMSDEVRAQFQEAADKHGVSLAAWIRESCLMRLRDGNQPMKLADELAGSTIVRPQPGSGAKVFKGPDFKPEKKKKNER